jgi:hypothetical protein
MSKVGIVVEGGLVQSVHSDDKRVQVAVLDYDVFGDQEPRLELDNFFQPEIDPELVALKRWKERKAEFLAAYPQANEE